MTQQNLSVYCFLSFIVLSSFSNLCTTNSAADIIVNMPVVCLLVREQQVYHSTEEQESRYEHVIAIETLQYTTNESLYSKSMSRIECVHVWIDLFRNTCLSWWPKEKVD